MPKKKPLKDGEFENGLGFSKRQIALIDQNSPDAQRTPRHSNWIKQGFVTG